MYSTSLNLLSPEKRLALKRTVVMQFTKNALEWLLIFICVSGMIMLSAQAIMENYFNSVVANLALSSREHGELNRQIKQINTLLRRTADIQATDIAWTPYLTSLAATIPQEISLSSLILDRRTASYEVTGTAATRDSLLQWKKLLEALPSTRTVSIPISQLTTKENLSFSILITLNNL